MTKQTLKFFYNGIKVNGGKLQGCYFSFAQDAHAHINCYASEYGHFSSEIHGLFNVHNDSDTMTDYFEKDRFTILPGTEYWKAACEVCIKTEERWKIKEAKWLAKNPNNKYAQERYEQAMERIANRIEAIKKVMDAPVLKVAC
jgi:hypothetical protein